MGTGRPPLPTLVSRLIGGALLGFLGFIFQPPLAILVGVGGLAVSSYRFRRAPRGRVPGQAYLLAAWACGMVVTFVVLLAPLAVAS